MRFKWFFLFLSLAYAIGFSSMLVLSSLAIAQQNPVLILPGFVGVIFLNTFFGWCYFRLVRALPLRVCLEWAVVWVALFFIVDALLLVFWLDQSLTSMKPMALIGYALEYVGLGIVAWLTRPLRAKVEEENISSPDLRLSI